MKLNGNENKNDRTVTIIINVLISFDSYCI